MSSELIRFIKNKRKRKGTLLTVLIHKTKIIFTKYDLGQIMVEACIIQYAIILCETK